MVTKIFEKFIKYPIQLICKHKAKYSLSHLTSHKHLKIRAIGDALFEVLHNKISAEEKELITLIEQRRSVLLNSKTKIAVIDYGAGNARSNRTKKEMEKGFQSSALVADVCKSSKSAFWAIFLFKLIRKLEPATCIELGSNVGISASYLAAALKINEKGTLQTLEGSPEIAKIAKETFENLNLDNISIIKGPFHETLKGVLTSSKPIDFLFNDGHHDHDAVIQYFNDAIPNFSNEAIIVFDDISWSPGMRKAWIEIEDDKRVSVSIDLQKLGIALIDSDLVDKEKYRIPL